MDRLPELNQTQALREYPSTLHPEYRAGAELNGHRESGAQLWHGWAARHGPGVLYLRYRQAASA